MTTTTPVSISVRTSLPFEECLGLLRQKLQREQFRVLAQVQVDREFENALGVRWRKCTVLIVWNSFYAYQALLSGVNGGLFLPFNVSVSDEAGSTLIATTSHSSTDFSQRPIGARILTREIDRRMELILTEFAVYDPQSVNSATLTGSKEAV